MAALEAELEELRAWKAQVVRQIPREHVDTSVQSGASQRVAQGTREGAIAAKGEELVLPNSCLGLGDLRHSFQARRESLHRGQVKNNGANIGAPSGISMAPKGQPEQRGKGKTTILSLERVETTSELEESMAYSCVDKEEIRQMQK